MDKPLEALARLPAQLQDWARMQWARWSGDQESVAETKSWSLQDLLNSAPAGAQTGAVQQALADIPLGAQDPRFFARTRALETLQSALDEWRDGRASMVSVHGSQGAGISSLLAQLPTLTQPDETLINTRFCNRLRDTHDVIALFTQTLGLATPPADVDELIDVLQQTPPCIIVLDDAYMLALRIMGTRSAVRTFGSILVASQPRHLWILGFRHHAWQRLSYLYQADRYFTHNIKLDFFDTDELKQAISQRFLSAQIELDWTNQDWSRLHQYSRGKPDLALLYSRRRYSETATTEEQPEALRPIDLSVLKTLEMDDLFTLAELAVHGNLQTAEHQQIFRESTDGSLMRLEQLCNLGLAERFSPDCGDTSVAYRITPMLSGLIAEHLYKVNYLY